MAGDIVFFFDGATSLASATLSFSPALVQMTRPVRSPNQIRHVALGSQSFIYERASATDEELIVEIEDIPTLSQTDANASTAGKDDLSSFIVSSLNWSQRTFTFTDPDGEVFSVFYWGGLDSMEEAAGRSNKRDRWTGTLRLRTLVGSC